MQHTTPHIPTIEFSVSYSLSEYLSMVQEHYPSALAEYYSRRGKPTKRMSRLAKLLVVLVASVAFYFKKRRMHVCHFTVDGERIQRVTQDGVLNILWTDVVAVRRYTQGYMVQKFRGAIPLPYRCLTGDQRKLLEVFMQQWSEMKNGFNPLLEPAPGGSPTPPTSPTPAAPA